MVNDALLEDTMLHIRTYPELHNPTYFFEATDFGLAACFAGRALLLIGYEPELNLANIGNMVRRPEGGKRVPAWSEAKDILRLDERQAMNLFTPVNTAHMLERKVKDLLNGSPLDTYYELVSVGS